MPEGPEIRIAADTIADVLVGRPIEVVRFGLPRLRHLSKKLKGHNVIDVETRGKALLTHFDHGYSIYSHNQLYGVWQVYPGHKIPKSNRSVRLLLQTDDHSAVLYSASDISVWPTEELSEHPFLRKLGPDIMNPSLDWRQIVARLQDPKFERRELAALYLDQSFLAGNGNYLRSEITHHAGLHPKQKPCELTRAQLGKLARSTLQISRRSYDTKGITIPPRLSKTLEKRGVPRGGRRFFVFGRDDLPCYSCGTSIKYSEVNGRRLYHCSQCQPY